MKPLLLMILDGFAKGADGPQNAIYMAKKPGLDRLFASSPHTLIGASGEDVGLPDGQMGNSEVGHTNIGAGRVVYQELTRITKAIRDGSFYENPALAGAMRDCAQGGHSLHLCGLLSDGGVHSHNTHLYALLEMAKRFGVRDVCVHALLDGRDVPPDSGAEYVRALENTLRETGAGRIATVCGRYYAMDRDNRWERVEQAYDAIVRGIGEAAASAAEAVERSYAGGVTDEFVLPAVIGGGAPLRAGDSFIFFNFRPDRARELTRAIADPDFAAFRRAFVPVRYVCMTQYDAAMPNVTVAYRPQSLENTLGQYLSDRGMTQLRIAETEKYAHVTFFFNGGREQPYPGEDRALIPSPKVATYDLKPEMSAYDVTDEVVRRIESGKYDVIVLNYANCDMVGHTGVARAAVQAVEAVDACVARVAAAVKQAGGAMLLTADHGNADCMFDKDGAPFTAHTTNPVPLLLYADFPASLREGGILADIAPTMLDLLGLEKPAEMTGSSLLVRG